MSTQTDTETIYVLEMAEGGDPSTYYFLPDSWVEWAETHVLISNPDLQNVNATMPEDLRASMLETLDSVITQDQLKYDISSLQFLAADHTYIGTVDKLVQYAQGRELIMWYGQWY